jgi:chromosome segregation ATPase
MLKEVEYNLQLQSLKSEIEKLTCEYAVQTQEKTDLVITLKASEEINEKLKKQVESSNEENLNLNNALLAKGFDERKLQAEINDLREQLIKLEIDNKMFKQNLDLDEEEICVLKKAIREKECDEKRLEIEVNELKEQVNIELRLFLGIA